MNYYEHHLGDYAKDVGFMPLVQEGAYRRLLDRYYAQEKPLPGRLEDCYEIAAVRNKAEREAVRIVLEKFFYLGDDGLHHQKRADAEIARYRDGEPVREVKRANEDNRVRRHREERAALFKVVTDAGRHVAWNIGMGDLRKLAGEIRGRPHRPSDTGPATPETRPVTAPETAPETRGPRTETLPATETATAPATPATATRIHTHTQSSNTNTVKTSSLQSPAAKNATDDGDEGKAPNEDPNTLPGIEPEELPEGLPDCPHTELIALYAKHLPELAQPRVWTNGRAAALRKRWRDCAKPSAYSPGYRTKSEGLQFWERYFAHVACETCLAKGFAREDGRVWLPDLPWLIEAEHFAKIIEGVYS